ncbi:MAG: 3-hydroxylacyl-ACP dehydratase [Gammaproteobacteria bacterium]|nr:3-hydroxylacyl-ACP dehydratase [Gammaproteobacteria bacterium]
MMSFPPIEALVPHQAPLLHIEAIESWEDDKVTARMRVRPDSLFVADGQMPAWVAIELMAQVIASYAGLKAWQAGQAIKKGFLLGTRDYKAAVPAFPVGMELRIAVQPLYQEDSGLSSFDCRVLDAGSGAELVAARLNAFEPPDFDAYVKGERPR